MSRDNIFESGLQKLAANIQYAPEERPSTLNPFRHHTPRQAKDLQSYPQAALLGSLAGGITGLGVSTLLKKNRATFGAIGAVTGLIAALVRHYDHLSDPPGLSPIYTVPAGASLGALSGALAGGAIGKASKFGLASGALMGAGAGAMGGAAASGLV